MSLAVKGPLSQSDLPALGPGYPRTTRPGIWAARPRSSGSGDGPRGGRGDHLGKAGRDQSDHYGREVVCDGEASYEPLPVGEPQLVPPPVDVNVEQREDKVHACETEAIDEERAGASRSWKVTPPSRVSSI